MASRPGRLTLLPGVFAVSPAQQPQSSSSVMVLFPTVQFEREHTVLGEVRIAIEPRDLARAQHELAFVEWYRIVVALTAELHDFDRLHAGHLVGGGNQRAEVD